MTPDDELDKQEQLIAYKHVLNSIKKPVVCDIEAQSVLVRLTPIDVATVVLEHNQQDQNNNKPLNCDCLNYTLELANETNVFNQVYTGDANEITLKDLKPNSVYFLRVFASLSVKVRGDHTEVVTFQTRIHEPEQPQPPKQTGGKKKSELAFRWTNPNDNGSKILNYILECREQVDGATFAEVYRGPLRQFIAKKLSPSTCYAFRLAAENAVGLSEFSKVTLAYTAGCVPGTPDTPLLLESTKNSLGLSWEAAASVECDFELQMLDVEDQVAALHGFITVYNGPNLAYTVTQLKRCCTYQFRVRILFSKFFF